MSALMAERRDWAEEPRQASLFDALALPPERVQPEQESEPPCEQGRVVEFPTRPTAPTAPGGVDAPAGTETQDRRPERAVGVAPAAAEAIAPVSAALAAAETAAPMGAALVDAAPAGPEAAALADTKPAAGGASAIEAEVVVAPDDLAGETCTPRAAGSPLAGPTLDDVMSRVWEGLVTGLPAACPVCHGEVLPSLGGPLRGRCTSCATTID